MEYDQYRFANLNVYPDLIKKIEELESKCKEELGVNITLIAYTQNQESDQKI